MAETFMELKNRSSISDTPLSEPANDFGTEQYVQGLVQFISNSAAPITIALQGEWGSGKTSLINRLYNDLCGDGKDFFGIKINTWEYSMLATPEETVVKIIAQLVREISASDDPRSQNSTLRIFKSIVNFSYRVGREALKVASPVAALAVEGVGMPTELGDSSKEGHHVTLSDLREALNQSIKKKIDDTKKKEKKGIVVFVDDLDRLNPPVAVQILELLKNIFTLDNCIFVLAIDYDVVVKGLEPKFGKLEPSNEREFRSFFDKIIQVPFQLPVNNYQPMDFVLNSLESIDYISHEERNSPEVRNVIEKVVVSSVGKNPRSIKRLINTLSLNDCITRCCRPTGNDSLDVKIVNFAFVAMQVCYPKIYNMFIVNPIFGKWDKSIAAKLNLNLDSDKDKEEDEEVNGEIILDALCQDDSYIAKNQYNICTLLDVISKIVPKNADKEEYLRNILKRSASTNIDSTPEVELDRKAFIETLHANVESYIRKKMPELQVQEKIKRKKNTGNGGFFIKLQDGSRFEVKFQPIQEEGKIALWIYLDTYNRRPERLMGKPFEEVIADEGVLELLKPMNEKVGNLCKSGLIEGQVLWTGDIFDNIIDVIKFRNGELGEGYCCSLEFWINLKSPSDFEEPIVVEAMGELILSAYELNCRALEFS